MWNVFLTSCVFLLVRRNEAAKILAYYPTPSISHQVVFRPVTLELARKGHEITVITTDPIFPNGDGPKTLTEIDLHDMSYSKWGGMIKEFNNTINHNTVEAFMMLALKLYEEQIKTPQVQQLLKNKSKTFDLVIVESYVEQILGFAYHYKAPVIQFSSLGATMSQLNFYGAAIHPLLYPGPFHDRLYNLTAWEKLTELYHEYKYDQMITNNLKTYDAFLKRLFGPDVPPFDELRANVDMLFMNLHSVWDSNRPVPPNVVYLGGLHQKPQKDLPKDLQTYLDSSKNGVIFVSFGTNVDPSLFSPFTIQTLVNVFSKLPYDVLWKWNQDELPGQTENIKISKWLPQSDLLRHPKIKLFITQGGLQSTDEAITAGVPLVGVPIFGDQKYNVEQYLHFRIGEMVDIATVTEEILSKAINKVLQDKSYQENVKKLRAIMNDQPMTPLERAVWWTEYVIRHKGAKHLRSPAASMSWAQYLELELVAYVLLGVLFVVGVVVSLIYVVCSAVFGKKGKVKRS